MTPVLERMIEDMKLAGYSERTRDTYLYAVRKLTEHFQKSPDQITNEELREYLLWHKDKYAPNTTTIALCGIKFFYEKILNHLMPVFDLARQQVRCILSNILDKLHRRLNKNHSDSNHHELQPNQAPPPQAATPKTPACSGCGQCRGDCDEDSPGRALHRTIVGSLLSADRQWVAASISNTNTNLRDP